MYVYIYIYIYIYIYVSDSQKVKTFLILVIDWHTSTSSQVSHCDGVVLEIYLDHKFQWPQEGLNCEFLAYESA